MIAEHIAQSLADVMRNERMTDHELLAETRLTAELLERRTSGQPTIRSRRHATRPDAQVIEIVNDDMPFLVDSVVGEVAAAGARSHLFLHPIVRVRRTADGLALGVGRLADAAFADAPTESVMAIHIDPLPEHLSADLEKRLAETLADVRHATGDWQAMLAELDRVIDAFTASPPPVTQPARDETLAFCRWLRDGRFTLLGHRAYRTSGGGREAELVPVAGSGRGILRDASIPILARRGEAIPQFPVTLDRTTPVATSSGLVQIVKSSIASRVHRRSLMDCIAFTAVGPDGRITGEARFVGLFTQHAYTQPVAEIPVLRQRARAVIEASSLPPASHTGKTLATVLDTMPRDELFQLTMPELERWSAGMVDLDLSPRVRLFWRPDVYGRFTSALVFIPRDRFSSRVREKIGTLLEDAAGGTIASFTPYFPEGPLVRVHFIIETAGGGAPAADGPQLVALEAAIDAASRGWDERMAEQLHASGLAAHGTYQGAFPAAYTETFGPDRALADILRIERLDATNRIAIDFAPAEPGGSQVRAAILRLGEPIPLSERVPILEHIGFSAIDESSYRLEPKFDGTARRVALHDMLLMSVDGQPIDLARNGRRMAETYLAVERGAAESDVFNRLVIATGADWREAEVMRALGSYMRQIRSPFGLRYIGETLVRHAGIARDLIEYFRTRHDPSLFRGVAGPERTAATDRLAVRIEGALAGVESLDEDRIIRQVLNLNRAILRTNFFQRSDDGAARPALALKFDSKAVDGMPSPRPYREIFVYSPRVEGVHLRFGPVARGGLRWSDRAQDFRTEVLGLCRAQQVKNTVIVPTGAKGGFVPKQLPRKGGRDEIMKEGIAAYELFVGTLLDVTDNLAGTAVIPPPSTIRHDADDPYLVVAADKGTATFSDFANGIAERRGFWLGDAFASGGSVGYDHKKMAITARGGWECVKRHFREMGTDIQTQPFRAIGVGDMSGDVFGNGMLLSPVIRLVAAFDHRDIFIDPDPDPATSFAERKRLFDLPRSSWANYDATKISAGGGVFSRSAKSIALTVEVQRLLGTVAERMTPAELMRTLLKTETDLLWFGGIGTYVRASAETDDDAGDRANDPIRVTGAELKAKVVGEGANLGLTQRGRMEFAGLGGRINTDFIDNSAGVNSSDQEVNIKIALASGIATGKLAAGDRNVLLASMTDDVAAACLVNNMQQSLALSLAERRAVRDIGLLARLMRTLERRGLLDRKLEALPTDRELKERAGVALTRPELAVLLSWSKIALSADLAGSSIANDPGTRDLLIDYFPPALRTRFEPELARHRLAPEIVVMRVTNSMINRGGPTFVTQLADETGRPATDIAYAYLAVRSIFGLPDLWAELDRLDTELLGQGQLALYARTQDALIAETGALLRSGAQTTLGQMIARHRPIADLLAASPDAVLPHVQCATLAADRRQLEGQGVPGATARRLAVLPVLGRVTGIARLMDETGVPIEPAARAQFAADDWLGLGAFRRQAAEIALADPYDRLAIKGAIGTIETASTRLAVDALRGSANQADPFAAHLASRGDGLAKVKTAIDQIVAGDTPSVSRLVVAADQVRELLGS